MHYIFGGYSLDPIHYELRHAGQLIPIEPRVFDLLAYLVQHPGQIVTTEALLAHLYPQQFAPVERLTTAVAQARKVLGDSSHTPRYIQTVRRRGYRFLAPVEVRLAAEPSGLAPLSAAVPMSPSPDLAAPASPPASAAERRQVTLLFCDLVDSTALAGQLDPEDYRAVLQTYLEACATVIARYEGNLAKFLGDGALVCFGYPQAHDDDPQRAVRAGLGIVAALARVNPHLAQTWGVQLTVRIGIHTGLVVAGDLAVGATHAAQALVGDAPNIAARLQERAAPQTVVCSAVTAQLVEGYFTLEALGPQRLKGVVLPVAVYRVVDESGAQTRFDVATARGLTPLVGREVEVALLRERWAQVTEGEHGDAGDNRQTPIEWPAAFSRHSNPEEPRHACETTARHVQR
jgi:class 3 adenylate cyclase